MMAWDRCCFEPGLEYSYWSEAVVYRLGKEHGFALGFALEFAKAEESAEGEVTDPVIMAAFDSV